VNERYRICAGATLGAIAGAAVAYLFFTEQGREVRDQIEPAVDELMGEFRKFRGTIEKLGSMAEEGLRALEEFQSARTQQPFSPRDVSH
jgi:gas vesicle protein